MNPLENTEVVRLLANGAIGITYLINYKGSGGVDTPAILKIRKLFDDEVRAKNSVMYVIQEFDKFASKYPDHFMSLKEIKMISNCTWDYYSEIKLNNIKQPKRERPENKSKTCLAAIYTPVLSGTLKSWYSDFIFPNYKQSAKYIYSFLSQLFYIFYLMDRNNWYHTDLNTGNMMYKSVSENYEVLANINGKIYKIPTFGYLWYVIDYDTLYTPAISVKEGYSINRIKRSKHFYILRTIDRILYQPYNNSNTKFPKSEAVAEKILKNKSCHFIRSLLPNIQEPDTVWYIVIILCVLFRPNIYMDLLNIKNEENEVFVEMMKKNQFFDKNLFIFIANNLNHEDKIIEKLLQFIETENAK